MRLQILHDHRPHVVTEAGSAGLAPRFFSLSARREPALRLGCF
jgi:hypothetical protein